MITRLNDNRGFTLIELVLVIVIIGILGSVAVKKIGPMMQTGRIEETKNEMNALAFAIIGNPALENNGVRSDFGYIGDVGSMPPNLDALYTNPGSYSTWNGPYINNNFEQITGDYKKDAWQVDYTYSGGATITSTGLGSNIIRNLSGTVNYLLYNTVSGNVYDLDGTPPGTIYRDSVTIRLTIPDGTGSTTIKTCNPDLGGYFSIDSIPIGNFDVQIIYEPDNDTITRFVSVLPGSNTYGEYYLASDFLVSGGGGSDAIEYVPGTVDFKSGKCEEVMFDIINTSGGDITLTNMAVSWSTPNTWYDEIRFDGPKVWDEDSPCNATGDIATFSSSQVISSGETITVIIKDFEDQNDGDGNDVDMNNVTFTIEFSDGSSFEVTTGACP